MTDIYQRANQVTVESYFDDLEWDAIVLTSPTTDPTLVSEGNALKGTSHALIVVTPNTATTFDVIPWFYFEGTNAPGWVPFPTSTLEGLTGRTSVVARIGRTFTRVAFTLANEDGSVDVNLGRSIS